MKIYILSFQPCMWDYETAETEPIGYYQTEELAKLDAHALFSQLKQSTKDAYAELQYEDWSFEKFWDSYYLRLDSATVEMDDE